MDAAIAKAVTEGKELRSKAAAAMHRLLTSGIDAVLEADDKAVASARRTRAALLASCDDGGGGGGGDARNQRLKQKQKQWLAPASLDDAAERVYSQVMARETALSLATVVCGPLWLAATQADMAGGSDGGLGDSSRDDIHRQNRETHIISHRPLYVNRYD